MTSAFANREQHDNGLGITARASFAMPKTLQILDGPCMGLPLLPSVALGLQTAEAEPSAAVTRLKNILLDTVRTQVTA